jgi:hypothetical protein
MDFLSKTASSLFFRKVIRRDIQNVALDADMIRLLLAINEQKSLYQIAAEVEMDSATFKTTLRRLLEQGLIESVRRSTPLLGRTFLQLLQLNLARAIGPMAQIVIDDGLAEMRFDPAGIPADQAADLVNRIALEIPDETLRARFKKSMILVINQATPSTGAAS